ncbi:hypothetical protein N9170_01000 [Akkermansiaceae bacterium]|nr:hypothetical protein [Akkermansiaceae bacterium]
MNSLKTAAAIGLTALAISSAAAQTASKPVGYETLNYGAGFTPLGLRLHAAPVTSGEIASVQADSITVTGADFGALLTAGTDYVLEIEDGSGIIQVVNTWAGETITTPSDLSAEVAVGTTFTVRPVANLNSVFGSTSAEVNLVEGGGNVGTADQIWLSDGAGGYDKYYFDGFAPPNFNVQSWVKIDTSNANGGFAVDGSSINIIYSDGIVMNSQAGGSHVVTGSVKLGATELTLLNGFTFVSSVAPAGQTLSSALGSTSNTVGFVQGGGNVGTADQVWIQQADSSYTQYYFDEFAPPNFDVESWVQIDTSNADGGFAVDGATIDMPSGYVVVSQTGGNVTQGVPSFYGSL